MPDQLILIPGNATQDAVTPAEEYQGGINFIADGAPHLCGWTLYVPVSLRTAPSLILRLTFGDLGFGAGTSELVIGYSNFMDSGLSILTGSVTVPISVPGMPTNAYSVDVDISSWLPVDRTLLNITLQRNSANPGDTFGNDIRFVTGRTIPL